MPSKFFGGIRYISQPSALDIKQAKFWIHENHAQFDTPFECAVGCAYDLLVFDKDAIEVDPQQDHVIPNWISQLADSFFTLARGKVA